DRVVVAGLRDVGPGAHAAPRGGRVAVGHDGEQEAVGQRLQIAGGGEVGRLLAVHAVGVQAGRDARGAGRERRARGVAGLDPASLVAARSELEGAPRLEVVRADAGLVARVRAAAVDRAAAVAVTKVRLAGAVRRVVGDDLGLGGQAGAR